MKFQEIISRASFAIFGIGLGFLIVNSGYTPSERITMLALFIGLLLTNYASYAKKKNDKN